MKIKPNPPFFTVQRGAAPMNDPRCKYPFPTLEVDHFFDVPRELDHQVRARASQHAKKYGRTYRVHRLDEKTVRVYRTA